jgi:opacity protein-like surface antigen
MRRLFLCAAAASGVLLFSAHAGAQTRGGQVEGFGGMTVGSTTTAMTFGGSVAVPLGDYVQIIGEAGRMDDMKSGLLDVVDDLTPYNVRLGAWYGEGGLRFIASPRSAVRPYVEATAGFARVTPRVSGAGTFGAVANTALDFLSSNEPLLGAGGGIILQGGPVVVDAGYRYKRIQSGNAIASALTLGGGPIEVNQVRVGIGFRF